MDRPQWPEGPELIEESDVSITVVSTGESIVTSDWTWFGIFIKYLIACGIGANLVTMVWLIEYILSRQTS